MPLSCILGEPSSTSSHILLLFVTFVASWRSSDPDL